MAKKPTPDSQTAGNQTPSEPTEPTLPALGATPAPRFEYEVLQALAEDADLQARLNDRGARGWQAFAVTALGEHRGGPRLCIFLRREVRA